MNQIDLCFSGSGVRFPVFIGALKAIEEAGVKVRRLVGSSGGALVGGLYKSGLPLGKLEELILKTNFSKFANSGYFKTLQALWRGYMNDGEEFEKFLLSVTSGRTLRQSLDFWAVTTDMCAGEVIVLHGGDYPDLSLARAIRASIAEPIIWNSVEIENRFLYDGGVRYNFALDFFQPEISNIPVVGVKVKSTFCLLSKKPSFSEILDSTINNLVDASDRKHMTDATWARYVEVDSGSVQSNNFNLSVEQKESLVKSGYTAMKLALPRLIS